MKEIKGWEKAYRNNNWNFYKFYENYKPIDPKSSTNTKTKKNFQKTSPRCIIITLLKPEYGAFKRKP